MPQTLYALETANPYPAHQIDTGDTVTYASTDGVTARANADNLYELKSKKTADENLLDAVLIKQIYDMIGTHALTLMEIAVTIANVTFLQVLYAAVDEWVIMTPQERLTNLSSIGAPWHESE